MQRMKKFLIYLILFVLIYLIVDFLTYSSVKTAYKDITNYSILTKTPEIIVSECKAGYSNGYIKGKIKNNTNDHINLIYIRADLYNEDGKYLGSEYEEVKYLNIEEEYSFNIKYNCNSVNSLKLSIVNEKSEANNNITRTLPRWWPLAGLITLMYLVP